MSAQDKITAPNPSPGKAPALAAPQATSPVWPWAFLAVAGLIYLCWAGSSYDPRKMVLWFTKRDGWFSLAPGLGHFMAAWGIVFYALSRIAFCATFTPLRSRLWQGIVAAFILIVALDVRLAILRNWLPYVLDPALITARSYHPVVHGRGWSVFADMATLLLLLTALYAQGRNLWLAALFAFHPLASIESAANGSWVSMMLPALVLLAMGWRLHRWLRELLLFTAAALTTWWLAHSVLRLVGTPSLTPFFNGLVPQCLAAFGFEGLSVARILIALEALLQVAILWQAIRHHWSLARAFGAMLVAWAILTPNLQPVHLLPAVALLVLEWNTAGWILSGTVGAIYLMLGLHGRGEPWIMPDWLIIPMIVPAMVALPEQWLSQWLRNRPHPQPASPVSAS